MPRWVGEGQGRNGEGHGGLEKARGELERTRDSWKGLDKLFDLSFQSSQT